MIAAPVGCLVLVGWWGWLATGISSRLASRLVGALPSSTSFRLRLLLWFHANGSVQPSPLPGSRASHGCGRAFRIFRAPIAVPLGPKLDPPPRSNVSPLKVAQ